MSLSYARQCSLMVHNPSTSSLNGGDEVILNPEVFPDMKPGSLIQVYDPENPVKVIVLKVPNRAQMPTGRMEISLLKTIAEAAGFKQFSRVVVGHISESEAKIDFVELSFRRQYLQRGNMLRFKSALVGRTIFQNQNVTINSMQANIQDLRKSSKPIVSGLVTNATKFVFRSKSARIVWLVQISAEMWDVDKDGEIYFEKFLKDFVSPVFDSWKALGVTHMLTIIFFARTLYLDERLSPSTHPELFSRKSLVANDGYYQQDHIKIVLENIADIDKYAHMSKLRSEFWTFARNCGWKITEPNAAGGRTMASRPSTQSLDTSDANRPEELRSRSTDTTNNGLNHVHCAVPSDSMHGNFLEAINISLNILSKHYMDRDLNRTGNSIVLISAGTGIFKVKPRLSLITKQRMLDSAFGIDCVSLARPPVHTVPLFVVNGRKHQSKDFYEVPHWMRISFTDCQKDFENAKYLQGLDLAEINEVLGGDWDSIWSKQVSPHPVSTYLSSQLGYYGFLVAQLKTDSSIKVGEALATLRQNYTQLLPYALRNFLLLQQQEAASSSTSSSSPLAEDASAITPATIGGSTTGAAAAGGATATAPTPKSSLISQQLLPTLTEDKVTPWGLLSIESSQIDIFRKTIILQQDVHSWRRMHAKTSATVIMGSGKVIPDIFDTVPNLKGVKEQHQASSYNSNDDGIISRGVNSMAQSLEDDQSMMHVSVHGSEPGERGGGMLKHRGVGAGGGGGGGGRHRAPSVHDGSSVGGHSVHSAGGLATAAVAAGSESRQESVVIRKTHLQALSRASEWDMDQMVEIFQAYDTTASHCFKRVIPQTVNLHDATSANSLSALATADEKAATAASRAHLAGRTHESLIEVDDDINERRVHRSGSHNSPATRTHKTLTGSALTSAATATATAAGAPRKTATQSTITKSTTMVHHSSSSTSSSMVGPAASNAAAVANAGKTLSMLGHAPMLGGNAAVAYSARLKPRHFTAPRPTMPTSSSHSTSPTAAGATAAAQKQQEPQHQHAADSTSSTTATTKTLSPTAAAGSSSTAVATATATAAATGHATAVLPKDPQLARLASASMNKSKNVGRTMMMAAAARGLVAPKALSPPPPPSSSLSALLSQSGVDSPTAAATASTASAAAANAAGAHFLQGHHGVGAIARKSDASTPTPPPTTSSSTMATAMTTTTMGGGGGGGGGGAMYPPAGMLGRLSMRGGIMRMMAEHPVAVKNDKEAEEFFEYQEKYAINPFRLKENANYISLITHNRRRWSHVFPMGRAAKTVDYSLNWKSLTQPAILPLNTDYLPKKEELSTAYTCEDASYDFVAAESPFSTLPAAVLELICQRLSHEYQLIDNFDRSKYLNMSKYTVTSQQDSLAYILTMGHRIHVIVGDPIAKKIWVTRYISKSGRNEEEKKEAETDRTRVQYRYEMWSTQSGKFQTLSQTFQLFPDEFLWSHIDSFILNETNYDGNPKGKKPRNLAYVIIPPSCMKTEAEVDEYFGRIDQLIEFLNKNVGQEPMTVIKERSLFPTSDVDGDAYNYIASLWHRQASREVGVMRRYLRGPKHDNPNWVYVKYDKCLYTFKAFHFSLEWFVCDSWGVDDFVNTLYRRSSKLGLRMCQTPGYYASHDLNIHPFRPIPYVQVPPTSVPINPVHSSPTRVVERLFFSQTKGEWIFDSERNTDWIGLGLPFPNYAERDRDIMVGDAQLNAAKAAHGSSLSLPALPPAGGSNESSGKGTAGIAELFARFLRLRREEELNGPNGGVTQETSSSSANTPLSGSSSAVTHSVTSTSESTAAPTSSAVGSVLMPATSQTSYPRLMSKRFDRQYIHCHGLATVRVGGQGFLWLPSASAKVSDLNTPLDEKNAQARQKLEYLESTAAAIVECYEFVVVDLMERVFNTADCRELLKEIVTTAIDDHVGHPAAAVDGAAASNTDA